jgi:hypothetical protein
MVQKSYLQWGHTFLLGIHGSLQCLSLLPIFKMKVALFKKIVASTTSTLLVQPFREKKRKKKLQRTQNDTGSQTQANVKDVPSQIKMIHAQNMGFLYFCMCTCCVYPSLNLQYFCVKKTHVGPRWIDPMGHNNAGPLCTRHDGRHNMRAACMRGMPHAPNI